MQKNAIAVFNPSDPVERAFQDAFHKSSASWLTMGEMKNLKRCLATYRGLQLKVRQNPQQVADLLFGVRNDYAYWYYPCDIVDLRPVLSNKAVTWHAPIILFSPPAAQKLMSQYPLCLVFSRDIVKTGTVFGGSALMESNRLRLGSLLKRIMLRTYLTDNQVRSVYDIIRDTYGYIPSYLMHDLPGLTNKVATETKGPTSIVPNETQEIIMAGSYNRLKETEAANAFDAFEKEFLVGPLPRVPDPDQQILQYGLQYKVDKWQEGNRGIFRYTDIKVPSWTGGKTPHFPVTRSLLEKPTYFTVKRKDEEGLTVLVDGATTEQTIPWKSTVFLIRLEPQ